LAARTNQFAGTIFLVLSVRPLLNVDQLLDGHSAELEANCLSLKDRLWRKAAIAKDRPSKGVISKISTWLKPDICQLLIHRNSARPWHC